MIKVKATVAYDGSGFHGFAVNDGVRTVAGDIESALAKISGAPVVITCAGRTDKGVHGHGQVISFDVDDSVDPGRIERSVNQLCRPSIVLRDTAEVEPSFDARFSATWRRYRYQVLERSPADPLRHGQVWHVPEELDLPAMTLAAAAVVGTHDFSSFCRRPKSAPGDPEASLTRTVLEAEWSWAGGTDDRVLEFWIRATSFCHQMVRSIVGTSVDVGLGRIDPASFPAILAARDRTAAGRVAPPDGLILWEVGYTG
jgi:tRNA pseudouridine38-40 synthase